MENDNFLPIFTTEIKDNLSYRHYSILHNRIKLRNAYNFLPEQISCLNELSQPREANTTKRGIYIRRED
uniref:Uncharacterized protein n=1 Tax=Rhizophora mucronata TaxID=61149 RepID=A0A2P2P1G0_RHIMU